MRCLRGHTALEQSLFSGGAAVLGFKWASVVCCGWAQSPRWCTLQIRPVSLGVEIKTEGLDMPKSPRSAITSDPAVSAIIWLCFL